MALTTENISTMANWTLEDIQNDPLGAVKQVRVLAASYLALQRERDAAVADLEALMGIDGAGTECSYCARGDTCGRKAEEDPDSWQCRPVWRGPQPEQVLAPADQSAGGYADNPVLAQA